MDAIQLHYLKVLVQQGSYNKASDQLYITRQGLRKTIQRLEQELNTEVVVMSNSGVVPTEFGKKLIELSEHYLNYHQEFLNQVHALKISTCNDLIIGLQSGFSEGLGPKFLADFITLNKDLDIKVKAYPKFRLDEVMKQKEIPIWICTGDYDEIEFRSIKSERRKLFLLVNKSHPLTKLKQVYLKDIEQYRLIGLNHDIGQQTKLDIKVHKNKIKNPDFFLNASDRGLIMDLVASGYAISFNAGWQYKMYKDIIALNIEDFDIELTVNVLLRSDATIDDGIQRFIDYVQTYNY